MIASLQKGGQDGLALAPQFARGCLPSRKVAIAKLTNQLFDGRSVVAVRLHAFRQHVR
jgi:hypothetical protein